MKYNINYTSCNKQHKNNENFNLLYFKNLYFLNNIGNEERKEIILCKRNIYKN